jgi:uncharacterized coiled-coil protein SlyX
MTDNLELELAVARERIRGLEELVAEMRASRDLTAPLYLPLTDRFKVVAGAALATAEADEPVDTEPTQPVAPVITWFKGTAPPTAGAPAQPSTTEA